MENCTNLRLKHRLCPGDVLVMTASLESLHLQYPGRYRCEVDVSCPAIFENNPRAERLDRIDQEIDLQYPLINHSDSRPVHFMEGFCEDLGKKLGVPLQCQVRRPYIYLSDDEKNWTNQVEQETGYKGGWWLLNCSWKNDYVVKKWRTSYWQEVVDKLRGKITFIQTGDKNATHPPLSGVINFVGKTDIRQLIRLAYHAQGCITAESFPHHLFAAFEKPCVTLCSGFLPTTWIRYHTGTVLTHQQNMTCCPGGKGCWKARVVKLGDGDAKDSSLCALPVLGDSDPLARCMEMISPDEVVSAVLAYYRSGLLRF